MDRGPQGWAEEVRSQPDAQPRGVFSPSTKPARPPACVVSQWAWALTPEGHLSATSQPTALARGGGGAGSCAPRLGVQAAPQSFPGPPWAAEKPLRSRLTSLGLTISGPSATQPSNPADGASPPETLRGALHPRGQKLSAQGGRSAGPGSARLTPPASGQRAPAGPG